MTKKSQIELTPEEKTRQEEAQGKTDMIQLTNGSGEYKKLTPDQWEADKSMLLSEGWVVMGSSSDQS